MNSRAKNCRRRLVPAAENIPTRPSTSIRLRHQILEEESDEKYAGKVVDEALRQIEGVEVGREYRAIIRIEFEVSSATGEEKEKRLLTRIEPVDG